MRGDYVPLPDGKVKSLFCSGGKTSPSILNLFFIHN